MHLIDAVLKGLDWIRDNLRGTGHGTWRGVIVVLLVGLAGLAAHVWFHEFVIWTHATLLVVAVLLAAIGYSEPSRDHVTQFICDRDVSNAPFMFAQSAELYRKLSEAGEAKRADAALAAFLRQVQPLQTIAHLAPSVAACIFSRGHDGTTTHRSVWAVCGRKDPLTADMLYEACESSAQCGGHIERVFFPPDSLEDERDILRAIERHLQVGMTVRAFQTRAEALATLYAFHLPRGFGMTWIGTRLEHSRIAAAFVHWGGVGGTDHHGVFFQGNEDWAEHLSRLCQKIHGRATAANTNANGVVTSMTLDDFLEKFPDYRVGSRTGG